MTEIRLRVGGYADSDLQERADLALGLQEELCQLGIDEISLPAADPPDGAKGSAVEWATLVVTLVGALPPFVDGVRSWLGRHPGCSIDVEVGDDRITLDDASPEERRRLIGWLVRDGR